MTQGEGEPVTLSRICVLCIGVCLSAVDVAADESAPESPPQGRLQRYEFLQVRMAVPVRISVYAGEEPTANQAAQAAYARIKQIDRMLSHYDPDSELSAVCRDAVAGRPVSVSRELFTVLSHAARVSRRSDGAFDVTVGPLMDLWRRSRKDRQLPVAADVETARRLVGYEQVQLDSLTQTVTLGQAGMRLDLGGIAKGYAADEALRVLQEHGIEHALIDAGGDIVTGQPPPGADGWRIGIAPLDAPDGDPQRFLRLGNAAVATSGDASQFVEIDGIRYSHIMDPRTGLGLTTRSSVTIVAPDGIAADSLASAVSVLGPERGLKLLRSIAGTDALIVVRDDSGLRSWESPGWRHRTTRTRVSTSR
ncbi:MAG: FAD:protein FMN transferase [Planctomycetaceae bacterium]